MFIISKILSPSSVFKSGKLLALPLFLRFQFSRQPPSRKDIEQTYRKLVTEHRKITPDSLVKFMHSLHLQSLKMQDDSIIKSNELDDMLNYLSSHFYKLQHKDLVLLLQTISQFPKYRQYNRSNQHMKSLMKRFNSIHMQNIETKYIFRLLEVMDKMKFPPIIITKYVNAINNRPYSKRTLQKQNQQLPKTDLLKFFISILQMRFITVDGARKYYEKYIKINEFKNPKQLLFLFYAYSTLQRSLQTKIKYFSNKLHFHNLVFNPYSLKNQDNNDNDSKQQQMEVQQSTEPVKSQQAMQQQIKQKMINESNQFISQLKKHVDLQKLKANLCKFYGFQKYPMDTASALILSGIEELRDTVGEYMQQNYQKMQPIQFCYLLQSIPATQRLPIYQVYKDKSWVHLSLFYRLKLIKARSDLCGIEATKGQLIQLLKQSSNVGNKKSISSNAFTILGHILKKDISEDEQKEILDVVSSIVDHKQ